MTRPARLGRLAVGACVALALTGCGLPKSLVFGAPETNVQDAGIPAHTNRGFFHVYFLLDGHLFPSARSEEAIRNPTTGVIGLQELFDGPTRAERKAGLKTAIPAGLVSRGAIVDKERGVVTVVLTDEPDRLPALAMEQLACTVAANGFVSDLTVQVFGRSGGSRDLPRCRLHTGRLRNGDDLTPQVPVTEDAPGGKPGSRAPEGPSPQPSGVGTDTPGG